MVGGCTQDWAVRLVQHPTRWEAPSCVLACCTSRLQPPTQHPPLLCSRRWTQDENGALQILNAVPVGTAQANGSSHPANGSSHLGGSSSLAAPQAVEMARKDA